MWLLAKMLGALIRQGQLVITDWDGNNHFNLHANTHLHIYAFCNCSACN